MPASLIQHFLCHPWHNISRFKHSSAVVCHGQVLLHSFKNEAMGTRENHDTPNLNPEVAMAWSWYVEIPAPPPMNYLTLLPCSEKRTSPLLTSLTPQPDTSWSAWSQGWSPNSTSTHLQACMHFLPTAVFKTDPNHENNWLQRYKPDEESRKHCETTLNCTWEEPRSSIARKILL